MTKNVEPGDIRHGRPALSATLAAAAPEGRIRARRRPAMLRAVERRDQVLPVGEEGGPLPHRRGQRLRRQHLAHPDDQDRQGLRRDARHQGARSRSSRSSRPAPTSPPSSAPSRTSSTRASTRSSPSRSRPKASTASSASPTENNVVIVPFDNMLDTDEVMMVNEDQHQMGVMSAEFLLEELGQEGSGKILEVRGLAGNSVDRDRHRSASARSSRRHGNKFEIVEVVGNWDDGTAQKVTADALAVHGKFDGRVHPGRLDRHRAAPSSTPSHPMVPMAGEGRERLPQARSPSIRTRASKGLSYRPVARPRRHLDEGGDLRPRGQRRCRS